VRREGCPPSTMRGKEGCPNLTEGLVVYTHLPQKGRNELRRKGKKMNWEPMIRLMFVWCSGIVLVLFFLLLLSGGEIDISETPSTVRIIYATAGDITIMQEPMFAVRLIEFILYAGVFGFAVWQLVSMFKKKT